MLGAFSLIPAFPLADGRILRAVLVKCNRNYNAATRIVVRTRRIMSLLLPVAMSILYLPMLLMRIQIK
ncbi:MAG: hypothetical protein E6K94_06840 [Thaumarchaeota archaeon]|nr:MAG: hypothetical protein E6L03_06650 [Nitrososphaerota archaeon]TLX86731.1 MAG: hypothetical protein E6L01_03290 [Nitrososphaerota archaeon]TLX90487.1 MAG: hypothetical protein E6K94_06840 [Nitrososphaerota archaeon]